MNEPRKRGRKPKHTMADKHEIRRYREAGVSIRRLSGMFGVAETTIFQYLREVAAHLGPEELPQDKKHLARRHLFSSGKSPQSPT